MSVKTLLTVMLSVTVLFLFKSLPVKTIIDLTLAVFTVWMFTVTM